MGALLRLTLPRRWASRPSSWAPPCSLLSRCAEPLTTSAPPHAPCNPTQVVSRARAADTLGSTLFMSMVYRSLLACTFPSMFYVNITTGPVTRWLPRGCFLAWMMAHEKCRVHSRQPNSAAYVPNVYATAQEQAHLYTSDMHSLSWLHSGVPSD